MSVVILLVYIHCIFKCCVGCLTFTVNVLFLLSSRFSQADPRYPVESYVVCPRLSYFTDAAPPHPRSFVQCNESENQARSLTRDEILEYTQDCPFFNPKPDSLHDAEYADKLRKERAAHLREASRTADYFRRK